MSKKPYYQNKKANFRKPFSILIAMSVVVAIILLGGFSLPEVNVQEVEFDLEPEKEDVVIDIPEIANVDEQENAYDDEENLEIVSDLSQSNSLEKPVVTEVGANGVYVGVKLYSSSGGRLYWEFYDESILSDELTFIEAIDGELLEMRLGGVHPDSTFGMQSGTTYEVRPVIEVDGKSYKGNWITFTTQ